MNVLHAFWLPEPAGAFRQDGAFHLWVGTSEPLPEPPSPQHHPRQLPAKDWQSLATEWDMDAASGTFVECGLPLPGDSHGPTASAGSGSGASAAGA